MSRAFFHSNARSSGISTAGIKIIIVVAEVHHAKVESLQFIHTVMPRQSGRLALPEPSHAQLVTTPLHLGRYAPVWNQTRSNPVSSRDTHAQHFLLQYSPTYTVTFYPSLCRAPFLAAAARQANIPAPAGVLLLCFHRHLLAVLRFAGKGADVCHH